MNGRLLRTIEYRHADFLRANPRRKNKWRKSQLNTVASTRATMAKR